MSLRPLMFFKPLAFFENPSRGGLHLDGGPGEDITPRADLFSGGVGEKKNVTEWVKNGETTAEAKALAESLQAQMEAIKRETNLQLVQEYRHVFDTYVLTKESYDSSPTSVDSTYKNKGALYVLEKSCPILAAQFKAYPDLRYLAYANATKQVPDVDVLPMGSTVSMVDGRVLLQRPGKPDASFMIFPWDYRAEIEKKYQELKPKPAVAPVPTLDAPTTPEPAQPVSGSDFEDEEEEFVMESAPSSEPTRIPELQPIDQLPTPEQVSAFVLYVNDMDRPVTDLELAYDEFTELQDNRKGRKEVTQEELALELKDGHDTFMGTYQTYLEWYLSISARTDYSTLPEATQQALEGAYKKLNGYSDRLIRMESDPLLYSPEERRAKLAEHWTALAEDLSALDQKYPNVEISWHNWMGEKDPSKVVELRNPETGTYYKVKISVPTGERRMPLSYHDTTRVHYSVVDGLTDEGVHFDKPVPNSIVAVETLARIMSEVPARKEKEEKAPDFTASQQYGFYKEAVRAGNIGLAREFLVKTRKASKDGTLESGANVEEAIDAIDQKYGRVRFELQAGQSVVADGTPSTETTQALSYLSGALTSAQGKVEAFLPIGPYKVVDSSGATVKTFRISTGRNPVID